MLALALGLLRLLDSGQVLRELKELFRDPVYTPRYTLSLDEERDLAYARVKGVCSSGLVSVKDFCSAALPLLSLASYVTT